MKKLSLLLGALVLITVTALVVVSITNPDDRSLHEGEARVTLQLQWFDQAQFIGFYVAKQRGFYAEEGINVVIKPGGYGVNPIRAVLDGQADIGIATADRVLTSGAQRYDIKALGTVFGRSVACFMSHSDASISAPGDLLGKRVGVYRGFDTENILRALVRRHSVQLSEQDVVDAGSLQAFFARELDVFPSYFFNEPLRAAAQGVPTRILDPEDFGIRFYSDTLFCTTDFYNANRDLLIRFLRATIRGWQFAEKRPSEALDSMYALVGELREEQGTSSHQQQMLAVVLDYLRYERDKILEMDPARWEAMERSLYAAGILNSQGHINSLCDFELAKQAQP